MAGESGLIISVTLFSLAIPLFLFFVSMRVQLSKNMFANMILKRLCLALAAYFTMETAGILFSLTATILPQIDNFFIHYMNLFGWAGYVIMVYIFVKTIYDLLQLNHLKKSKERYGEDD